MSPTEALYCYDPAVPGWMKEKVMPDNPYKNVFQLHHMLRGFYQLAKEKQIKAKISSKQYYDKKHAA